MTAEDVGSAHIPLEAGTNGLGLLEGLRRCWSRWKPLNRGGYMKGKISDRLERVLRDSNARSQLRDSLSQGRDGGRVSVGNRSYIVRTEVQGEVKPKTGGSDERR